MSGRRRYLQAMAYDQNDVGRCDFIDLLEEAVLRKHAIAVTLRNGDTFIDTVIDVKTHDHDDYAVFQGRGEIRVEEIRSCTRAEARPGLIVEDQPAG